VIAGSESANNDLPEMMGMKLYDFATGAWSKSVLGIDYPTIRGNYGWLWNRPA